MKKNNTSFVPAIGEEICFRKNTEEKLSEITLNNSTFKEDMQAVINCRPLLDKQDGLKNIAKEQNYKKGLKKAVTFLKEELGFGVKDPAPVLTNDNTFNIKKIPKIF